MQEWAENYLRCISRKTGKKLFVSKAYGGYRLEEEVGSGARDLSPRVSKKEIENIISTLMNVVDDLPDREEGK